MMSVKENTCHDEVRDIPSMTTYIRLNPNGTWEETGFVNNAAYIDDAQINKLWDPDIARFLRQVYGDYVCVMHALSRQKQVSVEPTQMFVLGGE